MQLKLEKACITLTYKMSPKTTMSSHLRVNYFRVSKSALHVFCTESARFQSCTLVATGAKSAARCKAKDFELSADTI